MNRLDAASLSHRRDGVCRLVGGKKNTIENYYLLKIQLKRKENRKKWEV